MPFETNTLYGILAALFGGLNIFQFFAFKAQIQKERALAGQETGKAKQENARGSAEEATAAQEIAKAYRDMVIDNEKLRKELKGELETVKTENKEIKELLQQYINQCQTCTNNKIGR